MTTSATRAFDVIVERDSEGWYVGWVPSLPGCHTQARSLDELQDRIREAILLCLDARGGEEDDEALQYVGVQRVMA